MKKNKFLISENMKVELSIQQQIQLPFFVIMNLSLVGIFCIIMIALFYTRATESALFMLFGSIFMVLAFFSFRKGEIKKGSSMATIGLLVALSIVAFFMDFGSNPYGLYRILAFALFVYVAKFFLSSDVKELIAFSLVAVAQFIGKAVISYDNIKPEDMDIFVACIGIAMVCLVSTTVLLTSLFRMSLALSNHAANEKKQVEKTLVKITNVLNASKEGLAVGEILSERTTDATVDLEKMAKVFSALRSSAGELTSSIETVLSLFSSIEKNSSIMQEGTKAQNESITESSVALTEISTNISSVNTIATQRSENMKELLESLKNQKTLVQQALFEVQKVKESSASIGDFIHTVEDIANQTGLLAMNASIEAAHAGTAGKGFAVIAQEIRKLSEETAKNAAYISDVLKGNEQTVETAANAVISFAAQSEQSSEELQNTIHALDGILTGISEMDIGTRGVMNSMQAIVENSRQNGDIVDDVSGKIVQQREIMDTLSGFASSLQSEVAVANTQITSVQDTLGTIKTTSEENVKVSSSVNAALEEIEL